MFDEVTLAISIHYISYMKLHRLFTRILLESIIIRNSISHL